VVPEEHRYRGSSAFGWLVWNVAYGLTRLVRGLGESIVWLYRTPKVFLTLILIIVPAVVLMRFLPDSWVLNLPVMLAAAFVFWWIARVPLGSAPRFLSIIARLVAISFVMFGYFSLFFSATFWGVLKAVGVSQESVALYLWLGGGAVWLVWSLLIVFSKPASYGAVLAAGPPQPAAQRHPLTAQAVKRIVPEERFQDVGGMEEAKEQIRQVVETQLHPEKFRQYGVVCNGILLHGPRGTGKTLLARATAGEFGLNFEYVPGPELHSRWIGATGENIQASFARGRERRPVLFFIDEIDALGAARGPGNTSDEGGAGREFDSITMALITAIEQSRNLDGFILMAATNRLDAVDAAVIREGRFDVKIRVDLPDAAARMRIFETQLNSRPWKRFDLREFARKTPGASAARIKALVDQAAAAALTEKRKIEERDLRRALEESGGKDRPFTRTVNWSDVVLDESVADDLRTLIELINDPARTERMGMKVPTGLLLVGPPGTGKTLIAELIASQTKRSFYPLTAAEVLTGQAGGSVKRVKQIFERAREHSPALIFLDEMDGLLPAASQKLSQHDVQVVEQFLTEISNLAPEHNVFLIGTTNHAEDIDPRILRGGRFSEKIHVGLPGPPERKKLLHRYLAATRLGPGTEIEELSNRLEGLAPADLEAICTTAKRMAFNRSNGGQELPPLEWVDFEKALARIKGPVRTALGFRM
jgi:transitional endoplasmic reticulum ATPase